MLAPTDRRNKVGTAPKELAEAIFQMRQLKHTWGDIQERYNVSGPVAKEILKRFGFANTEKAQKLTTKWTRPCIKCQRKERRSRGLFLCKACRKVNRESFDAPDAMYHGHVVSGGVNTDG